MAERTLAFEQFLKVGLPLDEDDFAGDDTAANDSSPVFRGIRPTDFGGRRPPELSNVLDRVKLGNANGGQGYYDFPFPQIFYGRKRVFYFNPPFVIEHDVDADTYTLLDFFSPAEVEAATTNTPLDPSTVSNRIHFADFGETWFGFTPEDVLFFTPITGHVLDSSKTINTGCAFRGQLVTAGFNPADYWGADWKTLWDTWAAAAKLAGIELGSSGPKQNWVGWSQVGGGDTLNLFFPNTFARFGERVQTDMAQVVLPLRGDHIVELPAVVGEFPDGWLRGLKARQLSTELEDVSRSSRAEEFWQVKTLSSFIAFQKDTPVAPAGAPRRYRQELKYVSPRFFFKSGTSYDIIFDYLVSAIEIAVEHTHNRGFDTADPDDAAEAKFWTPVIGIIYDTGALKMNYASPGTGTGLLQTLADSNRTPITGQSYSVTFTISNYTSGSVTPNIRGTAGTSRSANGTFVESIVAGSDATKMFELKADGAGVVLTVDDIGVSGDAAPTIQVGIGGVFAAEHFNTVAGVWVAKSSTIVVTEDTNELVFREGINNVFTQGLSSTLSIGLKAITANITGESTPAPLDPYDADEPYAWEALRRGEAGFLALNFQGEVLNAFPMDGGVVLGGEDGIDAIFPASVEGIPTFGLQPQLLREGLGNRDAIGGTESEALLITESGALWLVGHTSTGRINVTRVGEISTDDLDPTATVISYDVVEGTYHLSDGLAEGNFSFRRGRLWQSNFRMYVTPAGSLQGQAWQEVPFSVELVDAAADFDFANSNWVLTTSGGRPPTSDMIMTTGAFGGGGTDFVELTTGVTLVVGDWYVLEFTLSQLSASNLSYSIGGVSDTISATGFVQVYFQVVTASDDKLRFTANGSANMTIFEKTVKLRRLDHGPFSFQVQTSDFHAGAPSELKKLIWVELGGVHITDLKLTTLFSNAGLTKNEISLGPSFGSPSGQFRAGVQFYIVAFKFDGDFGVADSTKPRVDKVLLHYDHIDNRVQRSAREGTF